MPLVDTHCHLDFDKFDEERDAIVQRAAEFGVTRIVVPALDLQNCQAVLRLTEQYEGVFAAMGVHPNATAVLPENWLETIKQYAQHKKVVAIGEIGLDYYWDDSPKDVQHEALRRQLALAAELDLPVIIHNRDSSEDVIRLLAESPLAGRERPGVLHSFSADWATAQAALDMGFYLGFTGPVTFKKAEDLREIVARVPLDRILVETDAPYLTPQPYRGKRNEPGYVRFVAEKIAEVRGMETAVFAAQSTENAERLLEWVAYENHDQPQISQITQIFLRASAYFAVRKMLELTSQPTCDLSIIIVSWNVADLLRDCLRSIDANRGELDLEVIVVDSASSDGSVALVQNEFSWVTLLACAENVGFPKGNNLGLERANGRYLLLLNPDTVVLDDALSKMMAYMQQNPEVGVLGCQLLNRDGTVQSSKRRFPTLTTAFFESTWLETVAPSSVLTTYYAQDLPDDAVNDVDWVMGACMLAPRQVVAEVGGMDEAYFMYSEELDWCRRIKDSGWRVVYYPEAQIIHYVGQSSDQAVVARHINFQQAKLRYFRKYNGRFAAFILRLFLLLNYGGQLVLEAVKGLMGHKRPLRRQRIRAYWQVIRSGLHPAGY